jgi:hypothetical protein
MKAIRVNADYESVLFQNKQLPVVNETLEPLALFLSTTPIITKKIYSEEFLEYVEDLTERKPVLKKEGPSENWWGPLKDLELERKLNSKVMSAELIRNEGWCPDTHIVQSLDNLPDLKGKIYLAKNPFGMSGQNFCRVEEGRLENLERMLKNGPVIIEPLLDRVYDFSHYIFANGIKIAYQNIVDEKFQYKGTHFTDYTQPLVEGFPFYSEIDEKEWELFRNRLETIIEIYQSSELATGFSIDSFVYREDGKLRIRELSEVNYRRTMGQVAFELSLRFGGLRKWGQFILLKSLNLDFPSLRKKLSHIEWKSDLSRGVVILTPGNLRFDMFFLSAVNEEEGKILLQNFNEALSN